MYFTEEPLHPFQGRLITADLQTPYKIKLPHLHKKTLEYQHCQSTTGVGKPQADSEGNERIPPDGFDMVALEHTNSLRNRLP